MLIVGTHNAEKHLHLGMRIMREGGTALDAVERVIREVESDPAEHSVGVGGWPNLVGEVELDASIMQGSDRRSGAVGAVQGYAHPISIARKVMELTPHVFLVGRGAEDFARETGFAQAETLTPEAARGWAERLQANVPFEDLPGLLGRRRLLPYVLLTRDPERIHGTVNVLALDGRGDIVSGVSTSGWSWKYPGRLGASPVIGAGNYCDNRYGAAACTGHGELAIRGSLARAVVMHMEYGLPVDEACAKALRDAPEHRSPTGADGAIPGRAPQAPGGTVLVVVALDRRGGHCCLTNSERGWGYAYMTDAMETPEARPSTRVAPA
jgi:L-asparaginase / beta-aspartyl-peptidase